MLGLAEFVGIQLGFLREHHVGASTFQKGSRRCPTGAIAGNDPRPPVLRCRRFTLTVSTVGGSIVDASGIGGASWGSAVEICCTGSPGISELRKNSRRPNVGCRSSDDNRNILSHGHCNWPQVNSFKEQCGFQAKSVPNVKSSSSTDSGPWAWAKGSLQSSENMSRGPGCGGTPHRR